MSREVGRCVLPDAERHIFRRLKDARAARLRALEVRVDVVHRDHDQVIYAVALKDGERPAGGSNHDVAGARSELRVANRAVPAWSPKALGKSKNVAQPANCRTHVRINQNRDNRGRWGGSIDHCLLLVFVCDYCQHAEGTLVEN